MERYDGRISAIRIKVKTKKFKNIKIKRNDEKKNKD